MTIRLAAVLGAIAYASLAMPAWSAEAPPAPPATSPASTASPAADAKPFLGVSIDTNATFDGGVVISSVTPNTTAAAMGLLAGDVITAINKQPVAKPDDIKKAIEGSKVGDPITVDALRKNEKVTVSGQLMARPAQPDPPGVAIQKARDDIAKLKARAEHEPSLAEMLDDIVTKLDELEKNLPKAAEAFKKQYPNGEFSITISITISSDKTAKNPVELGKDKDKDKDKAESKDKDGAKDAVAPAPPTPTPKDAPKPKP